MMKDKLKQRKILIIALAVILTLSVGYAIFSESLNISGSASTGSTNFNIVFDRVGSIREVEASDTTADIKENGKKIEINVPGLSMPTAYAIIPVTIKNKGDITAKVKEIKVEGLDTTDIKVTYEGLAKEDIFNPNDEKEVNIKVVWDRSSTSTSVEATFSIEIVYEQVTGEIITTTTEAPIVDNRFIYEGTKLMGLSAEGEEYFSQPENKELIIPEGTTEIADGAFFVPYGYEGEVPDWNLLVLLTTKCAIENECSEEEESQYGYLNTLLENIINNNTSINRLNGVTLTLPISVIKIGISSFAYIPFTGDLILPDSVTEMGMGAFSNSGFNGTLTLSNNLNKISMGAFSFAKFTGNLIIPDSVTEIGGSAFDGTTFNGKLTLSNNLKKIGAVAFQSNNFVGNLVIPDSVTEIGEGAFNVAGFTGTLTLPNSIMIIGDMTFYRTGFTGELYIPNNVTSIGHEAFFMCSNLTSVSISTNTTYEEMSFPSGIQINKR